MIYESECSECGMVHEYQASVAERNNTPKCCGKKTVKGILTPPQVGAMSFGREKAFVAADGTYIDSGHQYKKWMADKKLIPADEGAQEAARVRKQRDKDFKQKLKSTAIASYKQLTT